MQWMMMQPCTRTSMAVAKEKRAVACESWKYKRYFEFITSKSHETLWLVVRYVQETTTVLGNARFALYNDGYHHQLLLYLYFNLSTEKMATDYL